MPVLDAARNGPLAVLALLALTRPTAAAPQPSPQPNIVLMIADDLGFNDVSFRGSNQIPTPNIDALAYSGVILDNHYVLPTCTPSRTAILTGQYPIRTGMQGVPILSGEPRGLPLHWPTLPQRLADIGYRTHLVGKWHLGSHRSEYTPTRRGFHDFLGYWNGYMSYFDHEVHMDSTNGLAEGRFGFDLHWGEEPAWDLRGRYATHLFTERAEQIIADHDAAAGPLYLQLAHLATHAGLNGTLLEVPDSADNDRRHGYISGRRRHLAGVIREMDLSVGRVVRALDERGMLNNTIIVFMSDNGGETLGEHSNAASNWPLRGQKYTVFEGGVRGAAVIWSSNLAKLGSVHQGLVHATDWLPTFYQAGGGDVEDLGQLDGISQWDTLTGRSPPPRQEVLVQIAFAAAIIERDGDADWKLVKTKGAGLSWSVGESGRGAEVPAYDEAAVIDSEAARALSRHTGPLTAATVRSLRAEAALPGKVCAREVGDYRNQTCSPYCLFDLRRDPCEDVDLSSRYAEVADRLLARLAYWENLTVPPINQPIDEAADPRKHNRTWVPWLDPVDPYPPGAAVEARPSTLAMLMELLALALTS